MMNGNDVAKLQVKKTDKLMLELIARGDKDAFEQLMSQYLPPVINFSMRYFSQRSDAEDIAQETFTRLWCKAPIWQDKGISVKAWLFKVAYNLCIDQLRKQKNESQYNPDETIVDEHAFIERIMMADSALSIQKLALNQLPERQCTAIMLCSVKGLSNTEAATVMGISLAALESLLARGRRKLKALYQKATEEGQQSGRKKVFNHIG